MAMFDSRTPGPYPFPAGVHRKPLPPTTQYPPDRSSVQALPRVVPDVDLAAMKQQHSTTAFPYTRRHVPGAPASPTMYNANFSRRTPSTSTTSTAYTGHPPSRTPSAASSALSRTSSSRSGQSCSPTSYVALMRKQKATVWCDRGQHEDPRIVAQQKAAKMRAARDISSSNTEGRTSTGSMGSSSLGMRSKIRQHNNPKATGPNYGNILGGGVPVRLSANEVGDEVNDRAESLTSKDVPHKRTDSWRLSQGTNQWLSVHDNNPPHRKSTGSRYSGASSMGSGNGSGPDSSPGADASDTAEMPTSSNQVPRKDDYFAQSGGDGSSGGSSEKEASFGALGHLDAPRRTRKEEGKSAEELRRRGSVDERANTLSGNVRLFVANPD